MCARRRTEELIVRYYWRAVVRPSNMCVSVCTYWSAVVCSKPHRVLFLVRMMRASKKKYIKVAVLCSQQATAVMYSTIPLRRSFCSNFCSRHGHLFAVLIKPTPGAHISIKPNMSDKVVHHPSKISGIKPELFQYLCQHSIQDDPILRRCREETQQKSKRAIMQTSPDEGQFLRFLIKALNVKKVIEVGVFTGYSSLCMALELPDDGKLVALDVSKEWTSLARGYWQECKVDSKVDLRLGPAVDSLDKMLADGEAGSYDFGFIDADKANYDHYYERLLKLIRPGGVIAIDNTLWHGSVIDESVQDEDTVAIRKLNDKLHTDDRVLISMLTLSDGVTLCFKR